MATEPIVYEADLAASPDLVLREADALYEGRGRLQMTCDRLARRFDSLGVPCRLVGGYALILHGIRRFTEDVDLLVRPADMDRILEHLVGKGYRAIPGNRHSIRDTDTGVRIDFVISGQFPGDGKPKPIAFPDPTAAPPHAVPDGSALGIQAVDLRTLIELKLTSGMTAPGRLQDLADVQRIIQTHSLTPDFAHQLHPYVQPTFLELCGKGDA